MRSFNFKARIVSIICIFFALLLVVFSAIFLYRLIEKRYIYPLEYKEIVFDCADRYELDRALVFSFIKVESSFDKNSLSSAGAQGLMQITQNTATYIAKRLNIEKFDIFDEKTNIEFGCYYLRYLFDKFTYKDTVICAYNAGEGIVKTWLKNKQYSIDGITFINIPYKETREYVNKINKSYEKYKLLYKNILDKR